MDIGGKIQEVIHRISLLLHNLHIHKLRKSSILYFQFQILQIYSKLCAILCVFLSSDASDEEHLNSNHFCERDEDEGHSWPASPFLHPDLPMGTQGPYVVMNQEAPPQMGFWDPFYTFNAQPNSQFRAYNGGNSDTHAYYMKRHTPEMKTVIRQTGAASTGYSNEYWSSHYQNGEDFFGYPPLGPSERIGTRLRSPALQRMSHHLLLQRPPFGTS
ncbi:hypothetical protein DM860_015385 [Cuscuta australis]|uniref:Uncharacterized protein n=1 Tax=Cuscuta australis TaxID=267555 RepID=A0A328DL27_9ASTE|nr:hypothetical protein DM860_015385 [Cuscuta australis]